MQLVEARGLDVAQCLVGVLFAEGREEVGHDFAHLGFLIGGKVADGDAGQI